MFISSTGGHLSELLRLSPMFDKYNYFIITEKTKSNLGLKELYPKKVGYLVYGTKRKKFTLTVLNKSSSYCLSSERPTPSCLREMPAE